MAFAGTTAVPLRRLRRKTTTTVAVGLSRPITTLQLPPELSGHIAALCPGPRRCFAAVSRDWCFEALRLKSALQRRSVAKVAVELAQHTQPRLARWQEAMDAAISSDGADLDAVRTAVRTCRRLVALGEVEGGRHLGAHFKDAAASVRFLNTYVSRASCKIEHRGPLILEARGLHHVATVLAAIMRSAFPTFAYMGAAGERCRRAAARLGDQDQLREVLEVLQEVLEIIGEMVKLVEHVIAEYLRPHAHLDTLLLWGDAGPSAMVHEICRGNLLVGVLDPRVGHEVKCRLAVSREKRLLSLFAEDGRPHVSLPLPELQRIKKGVLAEIGGKTPLPGHAVNLEFRGTALCLLFDRADVCQLAAGAFEKICDVTVAPCETAVEMAGHTAAADEGEASTCTAQRQQVAAATLGWPSR